MRSKQPSSTDEKIINGWNSGLLMKVPATVSGLLSLKSKATPTAARV